MKSHIFTALLATIAMLAGCVSAQSKCAEQTAPPKNLIARAPTIVIAQALGDNSENAGENDLNAVQKKATEAAALNRMTVGELPVQLFSVVEYLKGDGPRKISVALARPDGAERESPEHDQLFLHADEAGRAMLSDNCVIRAGFEPGARYLIFLGAPHVKGFEQIKGEDDPWLAYVRRTLSSR